MKQLYGIPEPGNKLGDYGTYLIIMAEDKQEVVSKIRTKLEELETEFGCTKDDDRNPSICLDNEDYSWITRETLIDFLESAKAGNIYELGDMVYGERA